MLHSDAENAALTVLPRLGLNKLREASRLIFEISKRENIPAETVIGGRKFKDHIQLKKYLLRRRYPFSYGKFPSSSYYLPEILKNTVPAQDRPLFKPSLVVAEKNSQDSPVLRKAAELFPGAEIKITETINDFIKNRKGICTDYNRRTETLFITSEKTDFFKPCPCTRGAVNCGYSVMNTGFGCPYDCAYCFLQEYQNLPGIALPGSLEPFFRAFSDFSPSDGILGLKRIGTGEFTDSLILDNVTGFAPGLIRFFREKPDVQFEFKTKSTEIAGLLQAGPAPNITVSWSLNPQSIIESHEKLTPSLPERLKAAKTCVEAGFNTGFHFDPLILFQGWETGYLGVIEALFNSVPPEKIAWISLGTLRFHPPLKKIIEARFPASTMLDDELILDFDGKMRYPEELRVRAYRVMISAIKKRSSAVKVYLCMESKNVWKQTF